MAVHDTSATACLRRLKETHKLSAFIRAAEAAGVKASAVYAAASGRNPWLPLAQIYALSDLIHPLCWFYTDAQLSGIALPDKEKLCESWKQSRNAAVLRELVRRRRLRAWCLVNGLNHVTLWSVAAGTRNLSAREIDEWRKILHPIYWFIPADENDGKAVPGLALAPKGSGLREPESPAGAFLRKILEEGRLAEFSAKTGLPYGMLYMIAAGRRRYPTLPAMYALGKYVHPAKWFCTNGEPALPDAPCTDWRRSRNIRILQKAYAEGGVAAWYGTGSGLQAAMGIAAGRLVLTPQRIALMAGRLPPEDWFRE